MRVQPQFDFGWFDEAPKPKHPPISTLFIAYLQQVAPELIQKSPIHKTAHGYATNGSPWNGVGTFEFDVLNCLIIHRYKVGRYVGDKYEYEITEQHHCVKLLEDQMLVA